MRLFKEEVCFLGQMVHVATVLELYELTTSIAQVDAVEPWPRSGREPFQEVICPVFGCGLSMSYRSRRVIGRMMSDRLGESARNIFSWPHLRRKSKNPSPQNVTKVNPSFSRDSITYKASLSLYPPFVFRIVLFLTYNGKFYPSKSFTCSELNP